MRILIAGAGAIGGWVGAKIQGHDVTLLGRPALAAAVAADGLQISGLSTVTTKPKVITAIAGEYDLIFITCKAHQTVDMARLIAPFLAPSGIVATMQNGLGNAEKIATLVPNHPVVVSLTSNGVTVEAPGKLRHAGFGATKVGPVPGRALVPAVDTVAKILAEAGLEPQVNPDMRGHIWQKAIINAGINPVAALNGVANGGLLVEPLWQRSRTLVLEAAKLAELLEVQLPPGDLVDAMRKVCEATAENRVSMLQDVVAKRPTEIEQITGRMLREAKAINHEMPESLAVYGEVKEREASYLGKLATQLASREAQFELSV